ncbi:MAG: S-layer homology domain-containing protein, partial [Peptoniphilus harei]|nr:S-layer homology domain-containing protein [Peptoniphilus harei]
EQTSSNQVNDDEQAEAVQLLKAANPDIASDVKDVKFSINTAEHAYYEVTYTDDSTSGKIEATNLKIKQITEYSQYPNIAKTFVADGQITITFKNEIAAGSQIGIIQQIDDLEKDKFCSDEGTCATGKCKITKSTIKWVSVDATSKKITYKIPDNFLEYGKEFGVIVKEHGKLNSCKKTKPEFKIPNVGVRDPKKLTDEEKKAIDAAIRKANTTNDGKGVSKLPDWTVNNIPAYIEFDKNGNVKIIDPSTVDGDWKDNYTKFVPKINDDGSIKLQDGKTPAKTVEPKEVLNNLPPIAPKVDLSDDKKNITITPNEADTDAKEVSVTYTGKDGTSKTLTATKGDNGEWTVPNGADGSVDKTTGVITLPTDKVKGGETVNATVKDDGFKEAQQKAEESKIGTLTVPKVKTKAEQVTELGGLDPVDIKKWVGDKIEEGFWKEGVKAKDDAKKDEVNKLLEGTTFTDETETKRSTEKSGEFVGKIKVTFDDGSEIVVENQKLMVCDHVTSTNDPKLPVDALDVQFKLGEGVKVEDKDPNSGEVTKTTKGDKDKPVLYKEYKVKPGTNFSTYKHPTLQKTIFDLIDEKADEGYTEAVWKDSNGGTNFVASDNNKVFTATATKLLKVTYDANGGSGTMTGKELAKGSKYTLLDNAFKAPNENQEFKAWEVDGKEVAPNTEITINGDTVIKAIWKDKTTTDSSQPGGTTPGENPEKPNPSQPENPSYEEKEIPGIKIRDHYTPTFPVYVTVPKTEKVEKLEEVPVSLETHKAYIAGYEDNTLRAEGNLTRAEAAAMVTRLAGLGLSDNSMPAFKDMQKNAWYFRYINAAVKAKMLDADNGIMRPNDKITRAEFAKMLAAIDKENSSVSKFDDIKGHRYEKEINKIYGNNRIEGYEDGSFRPDAYLTRAESAAFLNRMFNRIADKEAYAGLEDKLAKFKDFDASKWYYDEMVEATNSHELSRRGKASDKFGRVYEKWTRILPSDVK